MLDQISFSQKLEDQMKRFRNELITLKAQAAKRLETDQELAEVLAGLQEKLDLFENHISELQNARGQFWPKLKSQAAWACQETAHLMDEAKEKYLH